MRGPFDHRLTTRASVGRASGWTVWVAALVLTASACSRLPPPPGGGDVSTDASATQPVARKGIAPIHSVGMVPPGPVRTTPDPDASGKRIELGPSFVFELGVSTNHDGLRLTTISGEGSGRHVYFEKAAQREGGWRWAEFTVTRAELQRLVQLLNEERFLALPSGYRRVGAGEGLSMTLRVHTGTVTKTVAMLETFPERPLRVARYVAETVVDGRPDLARRSQPAPCGVRLGEHLLDDRLCPPWQAASALTLASLVGDRALAPGAELTLHLTDRTAKRNVASRTLVPVEHDFDCVELCVPADQLDAGHRYALSATIQEPGAPPRRSAAATVLTYGAPHGAFLDLTTARAPEPQRSAAPATPSSTPSE